MGSIDAFRRSSVELAPLDPLARRIQRAVAQLEAEGAISPDGWGGPPPRFNGYCARSCRAYYLLAKHWKQARAESRYPDAKIERSPGDPKDAHFWLRTADGRILDLNYTPRDKLPHRSIYRRPQSGMSFHRKTGDGRYPARRDAQKIMHLVLQQLEVEAAARAGAAAGERRPTQRPQPQETA